MIINFNIGLLGHVDSGKTTLAKVLSSVASTAAFDKNPQSKERGITIDLGFSALSLDTPPDHLKQEMPDLERVQLTFVDCPGHASLIRTIIGDAQKGIQTQTAECIVIGELLKRKLIVVVNKIDQLEESTRDALLLKLNKKLRKVLEKTYFGNEVAIYNVSAQNMLNIEQLVVGIKEHIYLPERDTMSPFVMYVDHCFSIKGQGTICTGTIMQGEVKINDSIEIPLINEQRKVKSIQMFRESVSMAKMGDRVGICVTQFNSKLLERGVVTQPGYLQPIYAACVRLNRIEYYKFSIKSKSKLHISVGHDTVMANITLFCATSHLDSNAFNLSNEYEYVEELEAAVHAEDARIYYALLQFETPIFATVKCTIIASKLDIDAHSNSCRLAFWGDVEWSTHFKNYIEEELPKFNIFKRKIKQGTVQRVLNDSQIIVQNLFKKEGNRNHYIGKNVELSTGEIGVIESTFGQTSKVKINFANALKAETIQLLATGRSKEIIVLLKFKKYIYNKNVHLVQ